MSKTQYLNGHDCSNSNRDLGSQTEPAPAETTTLSFQSKGGVLLLDPVEKGMRDISSGKSEASHVGSQQFLLLYCEKGSKDNHIPPPARA